MNEETKAEEGGVYAESSSVMLTGDRPTGPLHLGHYVGSLRGRIELQKDTEKAWYMIADVQGLTDNYDDPQKIADHVRQVALDNLAVGVDPEKTSFFVQSMVPEIAELTVFFLNLVSVARLRRNPTVKNEMEQKGYGDTVTAGFLMYPVSQAADILFCKGTHIPVGEDQIPMIEQANEIANRFNRLYAPVFPRISAVVGDTPRLVGIDGDAKASKSLGNAIFLSDDADTVAKKVMDMYTDPEHVHVEQPGRVEGNVVFTYLDIFDENKEEIAELKAQYTQGGLGDVVLKKRLIDVLEGVIAPIRAKREEFAQNMGHVDELLKRGTEQARKKGAETMQEVRGAMGIDYFSG